MAIFLQSMSAKLGIATENNLPQMCGKVFSRKINWFFWVAAELAAIATNLAEFLGGTLGIYLLFKIPLIYAGLITAVLTYLIVYVGKYGQRLVEILITILVGVIGFAYSIELFMANPDWTSAGLHLLIPSLPSGDAVFVAAGMLGATVMPHVIYLHSQLVQCRNGDDDIQKKIRHLKMEKIDIVIAMNIAFIINAAMLLVSASVFYRNGLVVTTIEQAHKSLSPLLGAMSSGVFGIALLASGLSSSAVGTMAGQAIMQGFVGMKIPDRITRIITILPGILVIISGINPMNILILSQVVLSFVLPMAIIPMLLITGRKDIMGVFANTPFISVLGWVITLIILILNVFLLLCQFI